MKSAPPDSTEPPVPTDAEFEQRHRWLLFCMRLVIIGLSSWILVEIRLPMIEWMPVKHVVIAIVAVGSTGKILYDTLFYDHYRP